MNAIEVKDIHKSFKIYYDKGATLKERFLFKKRNRFEEHYVLKGIDLTIRKGEVIGLIGENGCGKSTLLKLMTRIIYPDKGTITVNGKVSSLLELGAGFHPDMSGRENIYTNASIFGLTKKEIDERLEEIIAFSELGEFIDNPVRTYSSGMYMRLAFSVAINVDADILLVDEILAVGDAAFQAKCFNKMRAIKARGTTIVIVSHSLGQIEQICDQSIWIKDGYIKMTGRPWDVHQSYLEFMGNKKGIDHSQEQAQVEEQPVEQIEEGNNLNRWGNGQVKIQSIKLLDAYNQEKYSFKTGERFIVEINYKKYGEIERPSIGIGFFRNDGINCYGTNTFLDREPEIYLQNEGSIRFIVDKNNLLEGHYTLDAAIHTEDGFAYDYFKSALSFSMYSNRSDIGIARLEHTWEIK